MSEPTREEVERLAIHAEQLCEDIEMAATLRALLTRAEKAEAARDAAVRRADTAMTMISARGTNRDYWQAKAEASEAERDAARAEAARLRELVEAAFVDGYEVGTEDGRDAAISGAQGYRHTGRTCPYEAWKDSAARAALAAAPEDVGNG